MIRGHVAGPNRGPYRLKRMAQSKARSINQVLVGQPIMVRKISWAFSWAGPLWSAVLWAFSWTGPFKLDGPVDMSTYHRRVSPIG